MFNELVESCAAKNAIYKSWTVLVSGASQIAVLSLLILLPLFYTQALPKTLLTSFLLAPVPRARIVRAEPIKGLQHPREHLPQEITVPRSIPQSIVAVVDDTPNPPDVSESQQSTVFEDIAGDNVIQIARPPEVAAHESKPIERIKQGGSVQQAMLISKTKPVYSPLAIQTHVQGDVVLHAIIDKEGRVSEVQVISGHPLLIQGAVDAVRQWRYRPTMLNGEPVEVDTTITVSFRMGR